MTRFLVAKKPFRTGSERKIVRGGGRVSTKSKTNLEGETYHLREGDEDAEHDLIHEEVPAQRGAIQVVGVARDARGEEHHPEHAHAPHKPPIAQALPKRSRVEEALLV